MAAWATPGEAAFGHGGRVFGLAYHPASHDVIASASEDETARVWRRAVRGGAWEQTSCCRGHSAEVLRVAWSGDGQLLASGSADRTVRLWQVGVNEQSSYAGQQLAELGGHPEEIYGLLFHSSGGQAAAGAGQQAQAQDRLLAASGESLFLWDVAAGKLLQRSAPPPPPVDALQQLSLRGGGKGGKGGKRSSKKGPQAPPPFIFGVAAGAGTGLVAGTCCDGMLRLWDAARGLALAAAAQVHPGDMGCSCSFVPQQPWLLLSLSKSGHALLTDLRRFGQPLMQQQLEGPVFDSSWMVRPAAAAAAGAAAGGGGSGANGAPAAVAAAALWLGVVGCDECVRAYPFHDARFLAGAPAEPLVLPMGGGYEGRLLAVTSTTDLACIAAAGEPVPADTLKLAAQGQQQQPPTVQLEAAAEPQQQQQQQGERPPGPSQGAAPAPDSSEQQPVGDGAGSWAQLAPAATAAAAAAAAARPGSLRRRNSRSRGPVNILDMTAGDGCDDASAAPSLEAAAEAAGAQQPGCAAAAADVLLRAPLFTWRTHA